MTVSSVVLVGHCGPDTYMLQTAVERFLPGVGVTEAHSLTAAAATLEPGALLLINRVPDGAFDGAEGLDLVREFAPKANGARLMLVSNFPEAQAATVEAGAELGFGKADLYEETTGQRMRGETPANA